MNFFYRLPLFSFSLFLLSSAQSSGDHSCTPKNICRSHLIESTSVLQKYLQSEFKNLPWFRIVVDSFFSKTVSLFNMDYVACLANSCDADYNRIIKLLAHAHRHENAQNPAHPTKREITKSYYESILMMNIVMTKSQRQRFERTVAFRTLQRSATEFLNPRPSGVLEILNGLENGFDRLDRSTFENQNNALMEKIVPHFLKIPIQKLVEPEARLEEQLERSVYKKLDGRCGRISRVARRQATVNDIRKYFGVKLSDCLNQPSETCTLRNRIFALVAEYLIQVKKEVNDILHKKVCKEPKR